MNEELEMNDQIAFSTLGSSILAYQEQKVVVYSELVVESIKHLMTENNNLHEQLQAYKDKEEKFIDYIKKQHKDCVENIEKEKTINTEVIYGNGKLDVYVELLQILNEGSDK